MSVTRLILFKTKDVEPGGVWSRHGSRRDTKVQGLQGGESKHPKSSEALAKEGAAVACRSGSTLE